MTDTIEREATLYHDYLSDATDASANGFPAYLVWRILQLELIQLDRDLGAAYLARLLKDAYPNIEPLSDLSGIASQIDNAFAVPHKDAEKLAGMVRELSAVPGWASMGASFYMEAVDLAEKLNADELRDWKEAVSEKRADHGAFVPGVHRVDFDGKDQAHFDSAVSDKFCGCNLPGHDADNPAICPTCKKPHRI